MLSSTLAKSDSRATAARMHPAFISASMHSLLLEQSGLGSFGLFGRSQGVRAERSCATAFKPISMAVVLGPNPRECRFVTSLAVRKTACCTFDPTFGRLWIMKLIVVPASHDFLLILPLPKPWA